MKISLKNNNYFKYLVLIKNTRNVPLSGTNDTSYSVFCLQWKMSSVEDVLHGGHVSLNTFCLPFFYVSQQENCCCSMSDGALPDALACLLTFSCANLPHLFLSCWYIPPSPPLISLVQPNSAFPSPSLCKEGPADSETDLGPWMRACGSLPRTMSSFLFCNISSSKK